MLRQPRETLSSKQGRRNQTRHSITTRGNDVPSASEWNCFDFCIFTENSDTAKGSAVIMRDTTTVYLPKSLRQPPNIDADSAVDCHAKLLCIQPPSAINLKPYSRHRHWILRQPRETLSSKQGRRNQTRHSLRETPQGFAMSRQQANGTVLTSVSSQKTQIQQREVLSSCETPLPSTCQSLCANHQTSTLTALWIATLSYFASSPHQPST